MCLSDLLLDVDALAKFSLYKIIAFACPVLFITGYKYEYCYYKYFKHIFILISLELFVQLLACVR